MKYTNKQFQNIISNAWLQTSDQDVKKLVEAVKEDLMHREYTRKDQLNVLSRLHLKETNSVQRELLYQMQIRLLDMGDE